MELARARNAESSHKSVHAELRQCAQGTGVTIQFDFVATRISDPCVIENVSLLCRLIIGMSFI